MVIDTKRQYIYTSSSIRPLQIQEYFPLRILPNKTLFNNPIVTPPRQQAPNKARFKKFA